MDLWTLIVLAALPALSPPEVARYLAAADALEARLVGQSVTVMQGMPATRRGREVIVGGRQQRTSAQEKRLREFGAAYSPGDTALVSAIVVARDRIEVWFRWGGADERTEDGAPAPPESVREQVLMKEIVVAGPLGPQAIMVPAARRDEFGTAGRRIAASEGADREREARARRQFERDRKLGSRLILTYPAGVPLADVCAESLRVRARDALRFEGAGAD